MQLWRGNEASIKDMSAQDMKAVLGGLRQRQSRWARVVAAYNVG